MNPYLELLNLIFPLRTPSQLSSWRARCQWAHNFTDIKIVNWYVEYILALFGVCSLVQECHFVRQINLRLLPHKLFKDPLCVWAFRWRLSPPNGLLWGLGFLNGALALRFPGWWFPQLDIVEISIEHFDLISLTSPLHSFWDQVVQKLFLNLFFGWWEVLESLKVLLRSLVQGLFNVGPGLVALFLRKQKIYLSLQRI